MTAEQVLELPHGARALFTSRAHGNLSSVGGDLHEHGAQARERLRAELGLRHIVRGYQVHGKTVIRHAAQRVAPSEQAAQAVMPFDADARSVMPFETDGRAFGPSEPDGPPLAPPKADGQAVAVHGVAAMVLVADCVPVVLAARGAVAALHAGWRGLAAGVLEEGIGALRDLGGEGPVVAVIGPCAGACCYEVGEEVHAAFATGLPAGHHIDLRSIARERLVAGGVADVRDVGGCTICGEHWFSHRREGSRAGRQAALAWLA